MLCRFLLSNFFNFIRKKKPFERALFDLLRRSTALSSVQCVTRREILFLKINKTRHDVMFIFYPNTWGIDKIERVYTSCTCTEKQIVK